MQPMPEAILAEKHNVRLDTNTGKKDAVHLRTIMATPEESLARLPLAGPLAVLSSASGFQPPAILSVVIASTCFRRDNSSRAI